MGVFLKVAVATALSFCTACMAALASEQADEKPPEMAPQETEDWSSPPTAISVNEAGIPSDAIVLFDGSNTDQWQGIKGQAIAWPVADGVLTGKPRSGNISTKERFCDVQLHLEWRSPLEPMLEAGGPDGQLWGNSGVFLQSLYEVQILNSYQNQTYSNGQAGSIYKQFPPLVNASRAPGEWQAYDIFFKSPQFGEEGDLLEPARITVLHNGVLIQHGSELGGATVYKGLPEYTPHGCEPIMLQDHGEAIEFRNIWVRRLD